MERTLLARMRAGIVACGITALTLALPALPINAQETTERLAPIVIVLDASASMNDPDPGRGGRTKMDAAKAVLNNVIDDLPDHAEVGLVVYSANVDASLGAAKACDDIETVFPVGPLKRSKMKSAVNGLAAKGWTPIGASLEHAAKELPKEGARSIVLISDGAETCAPPEPCDVAKKLSAAGAEMTMHTVGFDVDREARRELECIAEAGGGTYVEAPDADTLEKELPIIAERALRVYEAEGIPVTGGEAHADAPKLAPGQYVDQLNSGDTRYYRIAAPERMGVHVAATLVRPHGADQSSGRSDTGEMDLALLTDESSACDEDQARYLDTHWRAQVTAYVHTTLETSSGCFSSSGEYLLRIERNISQGSLGERGVEILVVFEPPAKDRHGPDPHGEVELPDRDDPPQEAVGGSSLNNATVLPRSGTYTDKLSFGEAVFYRVPLDWGQGLRYEVTLEGIDGRHPVVATARTQLFNPVRNSRFSDMSADASYFGRGDAELGPVGTVHVYHANREVPGDAGAASIAGDYYLMVQMPPNRMTRSANPFRGPISIEVRVDVFGEPVAAPEYEGIDGLPADLMFDLRSTEGTAEPSGGHGNIGDDPIDDPVGSGADGESGDLAVRSAPASLHRPWVVAGGVVTVAVLVAGGFLIGLLVKRRRGTAKSGSRPRW